MGKWDKYRETPDGESESARMKREALAQIRSGAPAAETLQEKGQRLMREASMSVGRGQMVEPPVTTPRRAPKGMALGAPTPSPGNVPDPQNKGPAPEVMEKHRKAALKTVGSELKDEIKKFGAERVHEAAQAALLKNPAIAAKVKRAQDELVAEQIRQAIIRRGGVPGVLGTRGTETERIRVAAPTTTEQNLSVVDKATTQGVDRLDAQTNFKPVANAMCPTCSSNSVDSPLLMNKNTGAYKCANKSCGEKFVHLSGHRFLPIRTPDAPDIRGTSMFSGPTARPKDT